MQRMIREEGTRKGREVGVYAENDYERSYKEGRGRENRR